MESILPLLVITSKNVENVYYSLIKTLRNSIDEPGHIDILKQKIALVSLHNGFIKHTSDIHVSIQPKNRNYVSDWYKSILGQQNEVDQLLMDVSKDLRNAQINQKIFERCNIKVEEGHAYLVIIPLYNPFDSAFLIYLMRHVFPNLDNKTEINVVGLLPDLDKKTNGRDALQWVRTYSCICEVENLLEKNNGLVSSFTLLSSKNEKGYFLGEIDQIMPLLIELARNLFLNTQIVKQSFNLRHVPIERSLNKLCFYNSIGYASYVFDKNAAISQVTNRIHVKLYEDLDDFLKKNRIYRNDIIIEARRFVESHKWGNPEEIFESSTTYLSFSEWQKLNLDILVETPGKQVWEELQRVQQKYGSDASGFIKNKYLPEINEKFKNALNEGYQAVQSAVKENLNANTSGINRARCFLYELVGKEMSDLLIGDDFEKHLNLKTIKAKIADDYRGYLDKEVHQPIYSYEIEELETLLKSKHAELQQYRETIDKLEQRLFGWEKPTEDITKQDTEKLYFTINGQRVVITGAKEYIGRLPKDIKKFIPETNERLPRIVDLRDYMTPVKNQECIGSCTANALVAAFEYLVYRGSRKTKDFSRLFVYYNGRKRESDGAISDNGSSIESCTISLKEDGVCLESTWEYIPTNVNIQPHEEAYQEAKKYRVIEAQYIEGAELDTMKRCLAEGYPFVFGLKLFNSFQKARNKGIVPLPDEDNEDQMDKHGWHAMLCVGYSDADEYFIVKNSWGQDWGDDGYCYIPYKYMGNPEYIRKKLIILKTVSDVKEVNLKLNIAKESGSLFYFGKDYDEYITRKQEFEKLKIEADDLEKEYKAKAQEFERQNLKALRYEFMKQVEEIETNRILERVEKLKDELETVDEKINQLNNELKNFRKSSFKKFIGRLVLGVVILSAIFLIILSQVSMNNSNFLLISSIVLTTYVMLFVLAILFYKKRVYVPEKHLLDKINEQKRIKRDIITKILSEYDQYYQVIRRHTLNKNHLNFIEHLNDFINDELIQKGIRQFIDKLKELKQIHSSKINDEEIESTFLTKQACHSGYIKNLVLKSNIFDLFFLKGTKPLTAYLFDEKNSYFNISEGIQRFKNELNDFVQNLDVVSSLKEKTIYDFLYDKTFKESDYDQQSSSDTSVETKLHSLAIASTPTLEINNLWSSFNLYRNFGLYMPIDNTNRAKEVEQIVGSKLLEDNERLECNYLRPSMQNIVFFRSLLNIPAYTVVGLQKAYNEYKSWLANGGDLKEIFTSEESHNYSYIPSEIVNDIPKFIF